MVLIEKLFIYLKTVMIFEFCEQKYVEKVAIFRIKFGAVHQTEKIKYTKGNYFTKLFGARGTRTPP